MPVLEFFVKILTYVLIFSGENEEPIYDSRRKSKQRDRFVVLEIIMLTYLSNESIYFLFQEFNQW